MKDLALYLCRHGDTAWSAERRLVGRGDLPLVALGEDSARRLGTRLAGVTFARVFTSPLVRASRTAALAGFPDAAPDPRLREIDFGSYEGRTVREIRVDRDGYSFLVDGCPGGETPEELGRRVDAFLGDLAGTSGNVAVFAHSVLLRVLAARYLGLPVAFGRHLMLAPGALSILACDAVDGAPAIAVWNDRAHLRPDAAFA